MIVGVDTGGTFTDLVGIGADGAMVVRKVPSTPADPSQALLDAIAAAVPETGFSLIHGTTVATNALLQRRGARTALITTAGCRDVLEIGRQTRERLYDLAPAPRDPLVPRALRFEVTERLDWQGEVVTPLDPESIGQALDAIGTAGAESVAVCLLFSFLRPEHEREIGRLARERGLSVSLSCEVAPEIREYERTATTCANAFVAPIMGRYIGRLSERARSAGVGRLAVMQSNGGALRAEEAAANAVKTVLSGPAGGVVAAQRIGRQAGCTRLITFDMGGTSTDVALLDGAGTRQAPSLGTDHAAVDLPTVRTGEVAGIPILAPMLDIHTVGAGGGSIARLDAGGALRVGPESAGADPGPVAYGRGQQLTVTDANLFLGRMPATTVLAGHLAMDRERVARYMEDFARTLGLPAEQAAEGIVTVVNAEMARAIRHISVEQGHDPADYTLLPFGGAGGLHACALAEAVGIRSALVPRFPGAFSALGLALADLRREYARSLFVPATVAGAPLLDAAFAELRRTATAEMAAEGVTAGALLLRTFVEARYRGQSYALKVPYARSPERAAAGFHQAHQARYGHSDRGEPVEIVAAGITAIGRSSIALPSPPPLVVREAAEASIFFHGAWHVARLCQRDALAPGARLDGPAVVVQEDATTLLLPGWSAEADQYGNLLLAHNAR